MSLKKNRGMELQESDQKSVDSEFDSMRKHFESEMRRVEEEMQRLRREFEAYTPANQKMESNINQYNRNQYNQPHSLRDVTDNIVYRDSGKGAITRAPQTTVSEYAHPQKCIMPPPHANQISTQHWREHQHKTGIGRDSYPSSMGPKASPTAFTRPQENTSLVRRDYAAPAQQAALVRPLDKSGEIQQPQQPGVVAIQPQVSFSSTEGWPLSKQQDDLRNLGALVRNDSDQRAMRLRFDVSKYLPEEVTVRAIDNRLIVQAKHEEMSPGKTIFREYNQEFLLPHDAKAENIVSNLSRDGFLTVEVPVLPSVSFRDQAIKNS